MKSSFLISVLVCCIVIMAADVPSPCHLPAETGLCKASHKLWFYNADTSQCEQFTYGGCQGNENRFPDQGTCEVTCMGKICPSYQVWAECGSPCTRTCDNRLLMCITMCQPRCECPGNTLLHDEKCVEESECPTA